MARPKGTDEPRRVVSLRVKPKAIKWWERQAAKRNDRHPENAKKTASQLMQEALEAAATKDD